MRSLLWFVVVLLAVAVFSLAYLAQHALSVVDIPPLDAQQQQYEEENRRLIERLIEAEKRHAVEEELEKIRAERRALTKRFYQYNKTLDR